MKGLRFSSFVTDANNAAAFDICQKIAALDKQVKGPVTLLGEKGVGKSHLLWAIVNHFRDHQTRVSIALISAAEFPPKVRKLAANPAPLQKGRPAVLLVDELDRFKEDAADLEAVVRSFTENDHLVVLATRIHPSALSPLSGKFKAALTGGSIVGMQAAGNAPAEGMALFTTDRAAGRKASTEDAELLDRLQRTEAELAAARKALESSEGELFEVRQEALVAKESENDVRHELEVAATGLNLLTEKFTRQQEQQQTRIQSLEHLIGALRHDLESLEAGEDPAAVAQTIFDSVLTEKRSVESSLAETQSHLKTLETEIAKAQASPSGSVQVKVNVIIGEIESLLARAIVEGCPESLADEIRGHMSGILTAVVLDRPDDAYIVGDENELQQRLPLPGIDGLAGKVRQAFGDPSTEEDEQGELTWATPVLDDDEASEEDFTRPPQTPL